MIIKTLVENTSAVPGYRPVHGLSFYVETGGRKLLFDLGPDDTLFKNAETAGIDLREIQDVVISHGHGDHGGALEHFLDINHKAKIYVRENAFTPYYSFSSGKERFIGLNRALKQHAQVVLTGKSHRIGEGLTLFSGVEGRKYFSASNRTLMAGGPGGIFQDDFSHEQNLIVTEGNKKYLIAGCAHNGIVNILERFEALEGRMPDAVMAGFHLNNPATGEPVPEETLDGISRTLLNWPGQYYTCHCTGIGPYEGLKERMGDRIGYLGAGSSLTL